MSLQNILHDINYDVAYILSIASKWCEDFVEVITSINIFEYEGVRKKNIYQEPSFHNNDIEEHWHIVHEVDWSYDDSRRFESSVSIL